MSSRETILAAVKANQPDNVPLPDLSIFESAGEGSLQQFAAVLTAIGGKVSYISGYEEIARQILASHGDQVRIISAVKELGEFGKENLKFLADVHDLHDVEVAILNGNFGVAENGAVWVTENNMEHRALPFICQHLAVIINADAIVPTMHRAYELIDKTTYGFGTFIAGPSKTADIEQSLVIGAHGPRSMTVFVIS